MSSRRFLVDAFSRHAAERPNAIAVATLDKSRTFAELDAAANRMANFLLACGAAPGGRVGVVSRNRLELVETHDRGSAPARAASGEVLGVLRPGARPASNWIAASVPFFADPTVAAVVSPTVAPLRASTREQAAAAVLESRLGGGSRR